MPSTFHKFDTSSPWSRHIRCISLVFVSSAVLTGCVATTQPKIAGLDSQLTTGNYANAAIAVEQAMGLKSRDSKSLPPVQFQSRNVLDHLDAAKSWLLAGNAQRALDHFDAADSVLKDVDRDGNVIRGAEQLGGTLLGDSVMVYRPSPSEAVLINYYKAILFMRTGRYEDARVELNRAEVRTRMAVDRYSREITAAKGEAQQRGLSELDNGSLVATHFPEMLQWKPYTDFVLPPATYLQALYLGLQRNPSDTEKARNLMQRVVAMTENSAAKADLSMLSRGNGELCPQSTCVWIISEHGLGPTLVEKRIDLPVPTSNGAIIVSMALPSLVTRTPEVTPYFQLVSGDRALPIPPLASMDRTVQTEFSKRFPAMVARSTVGAIVKAAAQKEIGDKHGALAGLFASVVSVATTNADVRMWRSMPGGFSAARFIYKPGSVITIRSNSGDQTIKLDDSTPVILYVKQVSPNVPPIVAKLTGN
jgi:uncharacterized protein